LSASRCRLFDAARAPDALILRELLSIVYVFTDRERAKCPFVST